MIIASELTCILLKYVQRADWTLAVLQYYCRKSIDRSLFMVDIFYELVGYRMKKSIEFSGGDFR